MSKVDPIDELKSSKDCKSYLKKKIKQVNYIKNNIFLRKWNQLI